MQLEFCIVRATHKFKSLGFVCSPSFFSLPAACRLFSRGVIFTCACVSLALLSLRTNGGLLVVYLKLKALYAVKNTSKGENVSAGLTVNCKIFIIV